MHLVHLLVQIVETIEHLQANLAQLALVAQAGVLVLLHEVRHRASVHELKHSVYLCLLVECLVERYDPRAPVVAHEHLELGDDLVALRLVEDGHLLHRQDLARQAMTGAEDGARSARAELV